jgi:hypothetical protein
MPAPTPAFREGVNVLLARTEEIQKVHAHVFAGLADAQHDQVVAKTFFGSDSPDNAPERSKGFDGVLCVIVVPRHAIETQKREQLVSVLLQPILELQSCLALHACIVNLPIEPIHGDHVFSQKTALETVAIHSFHHRPEQANERQHEAFHLLVVGMLQHIVVQVPYQVDQALLLRALD